MHNILLSIHSYLQGKQRITSNEAAHIKIKRKLKRTYNQWDTRLNSVIPKIEYRFSLI